MGKILSFAEALAVHDKEVETIENLIRARRAYKERGLRDSDNPIWILGAELFKTLINVATVTAVSNYVVHLNETETSTAVIVHMADRQGRTDSLIVQVDKRQSLENTKPAADDVIVAAFTAAMLSCNKDPVGKKLVEELYKKLITLGVNFHYIEGAKGTNTWVTQTVTLDNKYLITITSNQFIVDLPAVAVTPSPEGNVNG